MLDLHEKLGHSHRKLANAFNHLHFASTGHSVGRTWVRQLLIKHAYDALHRQHEFKHQIPTPMPINRVWGIDTSCVTDSSKTQHSVLGIVDHGTRLNLASRYMRRFNAWTFLGCLFLVIGEFGKPRAIKMDNHPVFRSRLVKQILGWSGVRRQFSRPASPWENGRIERFFGTLKERLTDFAIHDAQHLCRSLRQFQFWYNLARSHQHLGGCTPYQTWCGIDPYVRVPKTAYLFTAWEGRLRGIVLRH